MRYIRHINVYSQSSLLEITAREMMPSINDMAEARYEDGEARFVRIVVTSPLGELFANRESF